MTTLSKEDTEKLWGQSNQDIFIFAVLARADLVAENERLKSVPMKYRRMAFNAELQDENKELRTALAAADAREEKLLDALDNHSGNYKLSKDECAKVNALLDAPRDDSALREMIAGVYEECAKACRKEAVVIVVDGKEERAYNNAISDCELAIRALAEKAKGK